MKLEDVAYQIAGETLALLEKKFFYRIPEEHKKDIQAAVRQDVNGIIDRAKGKADKH
jgi:hypothetical protein